MENRNFSLKRVSVENFKSFEKFDLEFGPLSIIVGANATGKSNIMRAVEFLRDTASYGIESAIYIQGGPEFFRNVQLGSKTPSCFHIEWEVDVRATTAPEKEDKNKRLGVRAKRMVYDLKIGFKEERPFYEILEDKIRILFDIVRLNAVEGRTVSEDHLGEGWLDVRAQGDQVTFETSDLSAFPSVKKKFDNEKKVASTIDEDEEEGASPNSLEEGSVDPLISRPVFFIPLFFGLFPRQYCQGIALYDIDPKLPKRAAPVSGSVALATDGSNLAVALRRIFRQKEDKAKFNTLLRSILPFVRDIDVQAFSDKSYLLQIKESHNSDQFFPASLLSDGTIHIVALVAAAFFEKRQVIVIEEPERNIHPQLMSRIVQALRERSSERQIVLTTHNPELLRHANLTEVVFVARSPKGFSKAWRPADVPAIQEFVKNEVGLDEMLSKNFFLAGAPF